MSVLNHGSKSAGGGQFAAGRHRERNSDEGIIPLINVVFLLLIFFMLAGKLSQIDPFEVTPPDSASESLPDGSTLTVLVGADGRIAFDGLPMTLEELTELLAERKGQDGAMLRLKADQQEEADRVIEVMESLRAAGIEKLSLLTTKTGTGE